MRLARSGRRPQAGAMVGLSILETIGSAIVALSVIALIVAAVAVGSGVEIAFLGVLAAFAAGTTGVGLHVAGREARFRREGR